MRLARCLTAAICLALATAASAQQTLTCSSDDMGRHLCRANTDGGVRLIRQRSGSPCTMGVSWGYDNNGIWVDHGCRADFALDPKPAYGGNPGYGGGNNNNYGNASPNTALQLCKDTASARLPNVPRAYINVSRATDADPYTYMINFRAQPPGQRQSSGFCAISKNGQLRNFQFDSNSGYQGGNSNGNNGGNNYGGQSAQDVMIACKNAVSARMPNVPLAYIQVNQPRVNGGSMLSTFRANPPNGRSTSGSCDVFKNGRVNLSFNN